MRLTFILVLCFFYAASQAQQKTGAFVFSKGDRIVLLGNTFADRMRHYGHFETMLQKRFSGYNLSLRNMGWSADEVGLQPRPLNFPGFGEKTTRLSTGSGAVGYTGFAHYMVKSVMPVTLNFDGLNQDLTDQKADVILLCFGMNEAFKGESGSAQF